MPKVHKDGTKAISVWLDEMDRKALREIVANGLYKDQSQFIRLAIREKKQLLIEKQTKGVKR